MIKDLDQVVTALFEGMDRVETELVIGGRKFMVTAWWADGVATIKLLYLLKEE